MTAAPRALAAAITRAASGSVGVDDGGAVLRQQLGEQAQLGGEIGLHVGMVVEVVAAEVGEGRRNQAHAVEAVLVEPVRGGFESKVRDALRCQLRQRPVQRDRIGRGERAVHAAVGLDEADGAERCGLAAERGEDLAGEVGDRGLAAGAGDGDDGVGLRAEEARRHQRERAARLLRRQDRYALGAGDFGAALYEDGGRALGDRIGNEAGAVGLGSGERGKQPAGTDLAAVGREAGDLDVSPPRRGRGLGTGQRLELHCPSNLALDGRVRRVG